jgi:hypothetical protein
MTIGMLVTGSIIRPERRFARQRIRTRARNAHVQILSHLSLRARSGEVQRPILRRPPDPLACSRVEPFHHHFLKPAHHRRVFPELDGALLLLNDSEPASFFLFGDLLVQGHRRCIRARRILEAEHRVVLDLVHQGERPIEVRFGFPGKAHDDVRRNRDVAGRTSHPLDPAQVVIAGIEPLHARQHPVRAGLHREVHMVAQHRIPVDRLDDLLHEVAGMRRRETHAAHSRRGGDLPQ